MRPPLLGLLGALALVTPAMAETPSIGPELRPARTAGLSLVVSDLERSKAFYTGVLGMAVHLRRPESGPAREYVLGYSGNLFTDTVVVLVHGAPPPEARRFGRLILWTPDSRGLAERVRAVGGAAQQIGDGENVVTDPDGYEIQLTPLPRTRPQNSGR